MRLETARKVCANIRLQTSFPEGGRAPTSLLSALHYMLDLVLLFLYVCMGKRRATMHCVGVKKECCSLSLPLSLSLSLSLFLSGDISTANSCLCIISYIWCFLVIFLWLPSREVYLSLCTPTPKITRHDLRLWCTDTNCGRTETWLLSHFQGPIFCVIKASLWNICEC